MPIAVRPGSTVQRLLPVLAWLPGYRREGTVKLARPAGDAGLR